MPDLLGGPWNRSHDEGGALCERFRLGKSFAQQGFSGETAPSLHCANDLRSPFRSYNTGSHCANDSRGREGRKRRLAPLDVAGHQRVVLIP